ncbi:peptide chain release factor N(5)-glutamine methyltransferase [Granulicella arctica]|uniref:Release factor glutamine methyltransferase n=1 Tax=Granulicella arctica TaxID=940613 RepID=A0A7Y9PG03_9BACT|nr:peptide chain release factor N(5)-glutamine methyltransferase [Granulicella arctica]NYF78441.1 release factor glutamine methyltransferase [Granulicella arctica]
MTVREAIAAAAQRLAANPALSASAARDAELLLLNELSITRASLLAHPDRELTPPEQLRYKASLTRRLANEPIQYILGQQEFYGLPLHVTPAVLIPRPETEHLVETVLHRSPKDQPLRILDIGTGSGAIAIALATHLPQAQITAVDLSPAALAIAQENAQTHAVSQRIRLLQSDLLSAVAGERFDVIVSNPPYIPAADRASLHPEVRDYEPEQALFAGQAGLDIYQRLIPVAYDALVPGGLLALEIGCGQREAIADLLSGWHGVSFVDDLQGIPRVAIATRPD